jgi:hypothetical protein
MASSLAVLGTLPSKDWRNTYDTHLGHPTRLAELRCLFPVRLELEDTIPMKYTVNMEHILAHTNHVPWTSYWTTHKGTLMALSNAYGVWFEVKQQENDIVAIRVTRKGLKLLHLPCDGLDMKELMKLGELIDAMAPPSCALTLFEMPYNLSNIPQEEPEKEPEQDDDMRVHIGQSTDIACELPYVMVM